MQLYQDAELADIGSFLADAYVRASSDVRSAKRRKPRDAAEKELKRLRKKEAKAFRAILDEDDIKELDDALNSPVFEEFDNNRRAALEQLAREQGKLADAAQKPRSFAYFVLLATSKRLCANAATNSAGKSYLISSTSLAALFAALHFAPWLAPGVVWIATKIRDFGQGVFCDALQAYLQQIPPPIR